MKAVVQVVENAKLFVEDSLVSQIEKGIVVFFCVESNDKEEKLDFFAKKLANLRIFSDENGKTNLSVKDVGGEILLVSQFTLAGDCQHGNRPSFVNAQKPEIANKYYLELAKRIEKTYQINVKLGVFGADMRIEQTNIGPFTVLLTK